MEQAPPDPERQLQPAPVEPLGGPGAVLEAAVGEETEGTREDSSGVDTTTGNHFWLKKIEISVSEAEKRTGRNAMNMQETYTAYLIETRSVEHADGQSVLTDSLWRRYSEFELLRNYLLGYYPHVVVPPLPEKRAEFVWHKLSADNMDPDFVERRRIGLENFLLRVASHPVLCRDKIFYLFLTQEGNWKETVNETGFQLKADSRLKALNATFRVKNPDKRPLSNGSLTPSGIVTHRCRTSALGRFTELKHYSDELQSVISHLLRVRARVADRLYGVYKVHGNYGRVFSEWSAIEKEMGDGLQSAGHHMDVYASSIDDILEDEEHYADQLKEYLFYAEALRAVCRKHELMQYDLETAAQDLASKKQQCEELATGAHQGHPRRGASFPGHAALAAADTQAPESKPRWVSQPGLRARRGLAARSASCVRGFPQCTAPAAAATAAAL
ncbi:sorting nexin-4 [Onychomys torridus]|uniref:sorting nexin-4 n=1 Tax=Onychomys torridus TaxID=38674 RepID=UPI00167F4514|nr:sorting nexin-4 [Onychomys torridus]